MIEIRKYTNSYCLKKPKYMGKETYKSSGVSKCKSNPAYKDEIIEQINAAGITDLLIDTI